LEICSKLHKNLALSFGGINMCEKSREECSECKVIVRSGRLTENVFTVDTTILLGNARVELYS